MVGGASEWMTFWPLTFLSSSSIAWRTRSVSSELPAAGLLNWCQSSQPGLSPASSPLWSRLRPASSVHFLPVCVAMLHDFWPIRLFLRPWPLTPNPFSLSWLIFSRTDFEKRWMTLSCLVSLVFLQHCSSSSSSSQREEVSSNMELEFCFVFPVLLRLEPDFVAYFYFSELMRRGKLLMAVASWWLLLFALWHALICDAAAQQEEPSAINQEVCWTRWRPRCSRSFTRSSPQRIYDVTLWPFFWDSAERHSHHQTHNSEWQLQN